MISLIATVIILVLLWDYMSKKRTMELTAGIPGPTPTPIVGTWRIFTVRSPRDLVNKVRHFYEKRGNFLRAFIFHRFAVLILRPDLVEQILGSAKQIKKFYLYDLFRVWLGQGLLISSGKHWRTRRKVLTPAFHFKILEQFMEAFDQQSKIFVHKLRGNSNSGKGFDVQPYVARLTLDTICEAAMGVKLNAQSDPDCEYVKAVAEINDIFLYRISYHYLFIDLIFKILEPKMKKRQDAALKVMHDFTEGVIRERSELLNKTIADKKMENPEENEIGIKKRMALLDILLQSTIDGDPLSNQDIREEVDNFMFAGHDTTSAALSFTLYLLSRHPHVQEKIVKEIHEVFGDDKDQSLTYKKLLELKYIECIIKESMRLFPPVPLIGRELVEDEDMDGHTIPASTQVFIPIFMIMKNPTIFPNPEVFDPDRHIIDDSNPKINPYAYIPFSAGPRNCIGQKFAMMEMKSVLCNVLRNYELLPLGEEPQTLISAIITSENGINIGIRDRVF